MEQIITCTFLAFSPPVLSLEDAYNLVCSHLVNRTNGDDGLEELMVDRID